MYIAELGNVTRSLLAVFKWLFRMENLRKAVFNGGAVKSYAQISLQALAE